MSAFSSVFHILKGCPLDKSYNHTYRFSTATEQFNYLYNYQKYTLSAQSYQRINKNTMRVKILADNLYDCNYVIFSNPAHSTKWIYAFIDSVNYINEETTEIEYTIDVMQTWYFDYTLGECFVEREHTETDNIGDNLVAEDFDVEADVIETKNEIQFKYMLGGVMLNKEPPNTVRRPLGLGAYYEYQLKYIKIPTEAPCGVSNCLYFVNGFAISKEDIDNHFSLVQNQFYMQDLYEKDELGDFDTNRYLTLGRVIMDITNAVNHEGVGWKDFSEGNIINTFQFPANFLQKTNVNYAENTLNYRYGTSAQDCNGYIHRPTKFYSAKAPKDVASERPYDYHIPINNKLYTFPYCKLSISNNQGNVSDYRFEDFNNSSSPTFTWVANYFPSISCQLIPKNYNHTDLAYNESISISNYPTPSYAGDNYTSWLQSNRTSIYFGSLATAYAKAGTITRNTAYGGMALGRMGGNIINNITGATKAAARENILGGAISGALSGLQWGALTGTLTATASAIGDFVTTASDIKRTPPKAYGQLNGEVISASMNRNGFYITALTIRKEIAVIIDNYFTMFGYKISEVKVPNIKKTNAHLRPSFNYIKTNGCVIHAASGKGLPSDAEAEISKIFDNGITFWEKTVEIGDYSADNSPTSNLNNTNESE